MLQGTWYISSLPNRFCFGQEAGAWREEIVQGRNELILPVPPGGGNRFCTLALDACDGGAILCAEPEREGFLCGRRDSPVYREPMLAYEEETPLYQPERVAEYLFPSPVTGGMYHPDLVAELHQKILKDTGLESLK